MLVSCFQLAAAASKLDEKKSVKGETHSQERAPINQLSTERELSRKNLASHITGVKKEFQSLLCSPL